MGIGKWVLGLGAAGAATEYGLARYFFNRTLVRSDAAQDITTEMAGTDWDQYIPRIKKCKEWMGRQYTQVWSILSRDGLTLFGTLFPVHGAKGTILCFHGYSSEGAQDFPCLAKFYVEAGYQVLLVDLRAHGRSEGLYVGFGCLDRWDALSWIQEAVERLGKDSSILLHGISMGGATVLMTSGMKLPSQVKGIISDCGFTSAWEIFSLVLHTRYHLPSFPLMQIADRMAKAKAGYGLAECSASREVEKAEVPILLIHGDADTFVPCWMSYEIYAHCGSQAHLMIVKGASHAEAYHKDREGYEKAVLSFLKDVMGREEAYA